MKRKIAAIVAADIAGYSRLIAEDEEDTLRRLKGHRQVYDGLVEQYGGRIFNTAGDAVLSEFPSSVDAVRCAIEIQESLRRLNRAYQSSRHMNFRIGISLGDVVERDGDLLGDGVNIAARLEGLAEPGGICIARSVHEQVAAKLSVAFTDIGQQMVKNIPQPIHAYTLSLAEPSGPKAAEPAALLSPMLAAEPAPPSSTWVSATVAAVALLLTLAGAGGFYAYTWHLAPVSTEKQLASAPAPTQPPSADVTPDDVTPLNLGDLTGPARTNSTVEPDKIPYITQADQAAVERIYLPASDHKVLALSLNGTMAMSTSRPTEESAQAAALESCKERPTSRGCFVYAVGNQVVSKAGPPPMPPTPWVTTDERLRQPFDVMKLPFLSQSNKELLRDAFAKHKPVKTVAISAAGNFQVYGSQISETEGVRRALESCGGRSGTPCRIVGIDDKLVLPIPESYNITGFFDAWITPAIASNARSLVAAKIAISERGWSAVAVGENALAGLSTGAESEDTAVKDALADCSRLTSACRVLAIGAFTVAPK